jgi:hypothetical protein
MRQKILPAATRGIGQQALVPNLVCLVTKTRPIKGALMSMERLPFLFPSVR